MKTLKVSFIDLHEQAPLPEIQSRLLKLERHELNFLLWSSATDKPTVFFSIAHNNQSIFIHFDVKEKFFRAVEKNTNGPVWQDSCVEFFLALNDSNYYNIEINAIGTRLAGFGANRNDRGFLPKQAVEKIVTYSTLEQGDVHHWSLTLKIPVDIFIHDKIETLEGKKCRANFYKCGDKLPVAHYLAWNDIKSAQPNFHLSEYFGEIEFEVKLKR